MSNSTYAYVFGGSGSLSGTMSLTKDGTNALILNSANSYAGGTMINNGTLRLGNNGALGSGTVTLGSSGGAASLSSASTAARTVATWCGLTPPPPWATWPTAAC